MMPPPAADLFSPAGHTLLRAAPLSFAKLFYSGIDWLTARQRQLSGDRQFSFYGGLRTEAAATFNSYLLMSELANREAPAESCTISGIYFSMESRQALCDGKVLSLGMRQFRLLEIFALRTNEILTRDELEEAVWQGKVHAATLLNSIACLRRKMGQCAFPATILTARNKGFLFRLNAQGGASQHH